MQPVPSQNNPAQDRASAKEVGLFEGTAWYYSRFRRGYPKTAIDTIIKYFRLDGASHVLDLGCGTGQLAIPLAGRGIPVHAMDPDLEMLTQGLHAAHDAGVLGIAWYEGDDTVLAKIPLPPLKLCAMGASFHWMDRDRLLNTLQRLIVLDGGIAILGSKSVWAQADSSTTPSISTIIKNVVTEFLGPERRAGSGTYKAPSERYESLLARSPFSHVEVMEFEAVHEKTVEEIVGLQLSTSYASPAQLGSRLSDFKSTLTERLLAIEPSGKFVDTETTSVILASRPAAGPLLESKAHA